MANGKGGSIAAGRFITFFKSFVTFIFISAGNGGKLLADGRKMLLRLTMTDAIALLPADTFVRVHRSYLVNKNKIDRIERHQLHIAG